MQFLTSGDKKKLCAYHIPVVAKHKPAPLKIGRPDTILYMMNFSAILPCNCPWTAGAVNNLQLPYQPSSQLQPHHSNDSTL
jgi:hypothetical protein